MEEVERALQPFIQKYNIASHQRSAMAIPNDAKFRVILIISDTYTHSYLFEYHGTSTHIPSLKYSSYSLIFNNTHDIVDFDSP